MRNYAKKILSLALVICLSTILCYVGDSGAAKAETNSNTTKDTTVKKSALTLTFSKKSGVYDAAFNLELTCSGATAIYYTTDGSDPVTSSTKKQYSSAINITDRSNDKNILTAVDPFLFDAANIKLNSKRDGFIGTSKAPEDKDVDKCTVVRAVAVDSQGLYTDVATNTYFIGSMANHIKGIQDSCKAAGTSLAVISLSIDYADLFDSKTGIYVKGDIYDQAVANYFKTSKRINAGDGRNLDANYKQTGKEWERKAHVDYFESDGTTTKLQLEQNCGIRIQGNYSRSDLQKSFRLLAKSDYGKKNFEYPFFGEKLKDDSGKTISKFKTLTLRNGGNCAFSAKYADAYWQSLVRNMNFDTQNSRPCVVYIDGEYWGLYILQEDYTEDYFEEAHGVNSDDVVLYKGDAEKYVSGYKLDLGDLPEGVTDENYYFNDLLNFFKKHKNLSKTADYKAFSKLVDVKSARDYFAMEIWINNKWDWPGKNWSMWKTAKVDSKNPYADGKWRFCLYDDEFGGVSGSSDAYVNTIKDDNYMPDGLLDLNTEQKPNVLVYAYLMTNKTFRADFIKTLKSLSTKNLKSSTALAQLEVFNNTYSPLYDQFFARYPQPATNYTKTNAISGGYASYKCIKDFLNLRAKYIQPMVDYVNDFYKSSK